MVRVEKAAGKSGIASVGGVLDDVLSAYANSRHYYCSHARHYSVSPQELTTMTLRYVRETADVVSVTYDRRSIVTGALSGKVPSNGESATWRRRHDNSELTGSYPPKQRIVNFVIQDVTVCPTTGIRVIIKEDWLETSLGKKSSQSIWTPEWPRE